MHVRVEMGLPMYSRAQDHFKNTVVSSYHYFGSAAFGKVVEGHDMKVKGIENLHVAWLELNYLMSLVEGSIQRGASKFTNRSIEIGSSGFVENGDRKARRTVHKN